MSRLSSTSEKGFTLVELAIALVVIGLLIAGILKGQELIENSKVTSFMRQIKGYDAAAMIFRDTYGALPGDTDTPHLIPDCTEEFCSKPGDKNGQIGPYLDPEIVNFFPHMTKAKLIQADTTGAASHPINNDNADLVYPKTPFDQYVQVMVREFDGSNANQYITPVGHLYGDDNIETMRPQVYIAIDNKLDDGKPGTGDVRVDLDGARCPVTCVAGVCEYNVQVVNASPEGCMINILAGF